LFEDPAAQAPAGEVTQATEQPTEAPPLLRSRLSSFAWNYPWWWAIL